MSGRPWSRRFLAGTISAALLASLLISAPAPAAAQQSTEPVAPPAEPVNTHGRLVTGRAWQHNRVVDTPVPAMAWPAGGQATVDLGPRASQGRVRAGSLPVWVDRGAGSAGAGLNKVDVRVLDRATLPEAWRDRVVIELASPSGVAGAATVSVDYAAFRYAGGAEWASRLRLWQVPSCALRAPESAACQSRPLPSINDTQAGTVSADVTVSAGPGRPAAGGEFAGESAADGGARQLVVLAAGPAGEDGDFSATSLAASSTWSAGESGGSFSWSYPLRTPPASGGPVPEVSLAYSSSAVDGRSEATNNQPSWVGEGFEYSPGFIERRYVRCGDDRQSGASNTVETGDLCWRSDNATMSLNGGGSELVFETGKGWHARTENGAKIDKLTGAGNGDSGSAGDLGEYWRVTTTDGTQYYFGLHSLPGHTEKTNAALTVPVFGNHTGEPCRGATFAASSCAQAYRWNLDYVVDVRGNTMSYWYVKDTNKYARNLTDSDDVSYDRASFLARIDYGTYDRTLATHGITERSIEPHVQVVFEPGMRCTSNCGTEAEPVQANWKDTPFDLQCEASATSCPQQYSPTFWTSKRLAKITTRVWETTAAPVNVESWTLTHTFAATGDSTHTGMWLDQIVRTGLVGTPVVMPPVTFGAVSLANRVLTAHGTTHNWLRIADIVTESGARIHVDYSLPECTATNKPADAHANAMRCYPVLVEDPEDENKTLTRWWHKYRVEHVAEDDIQLTEGQPAPSRHTWYEYVGSPAWHYADDDGLSMPRYKTWSQWRGYATVKTRMGDNPGTNSLTVTTFLRGMHGDRAGPAGGTRTVTVPASLGTETVYDEDQFAGMVRERIVYNGVEAEPVSATVHVPWRSPPTASRTINGDLVEARFVNVQTGYTGTALGVDGSRGWRTARTATNFDSTYGTANWVQEDGDLAVTGDERCTTHTYARNTTKHIVTTINRTTTTAIVCGAAPATVDDVITDTRTFFDGAASIDTPPAFGSVTKTDALKSWAVGAGTTWQTASQATYDTVGRVKTSTDIKGNVTGTAYTPAVGGPVTRVTTTGPAPFNWVTTEDRSPFWGATTKTTDENNRVTAEVEYDALGRVAKVWELGWSRATNATTPSARYAYTFAPGRNAYPYVMTQALNPDGNYLTSYEIVDALLRPRQTQSPSMSGDGTRVVTDTLYDDQGRALTRYRSHVEPHAPSGALWWIPEWSAPAVERTVYDRASRTTASVFLAGDGTVNLIEQWRTTTQHEGDLTKVAPPSGGVATTTLTDVWGRTTAVRQHTTTSGVAGPYQETRYVFNRKGQAVETIDAAGNEWTTTYDAKGRVVQSADPDKGTTTSQYNDANELVKSTDARGEALWYVYDQIGRKTQLRDDSATGALRAEWKYDLLYSGQPGFKGQLTQKIRYEPAGSATAYKWQVRQFDGRYQPTGVNYVIPAGVADGLNTTYIYAYSYSGATGTQESISYPLGGGLVAEKVTTGLDPVTGMATSLDTSLAGWTGTKATADYTAYGERNRSTYRMPGGVSVWETVYREEATRRINRTTVHRETVAGTVSDRAYDYDEAGNVEWVREAPEIGPADTQCFRYDSLARLTTAWTPGGSATCQTSPSVPSLGGPAPYWLAWTFNSTNSRLTEASHAAAGTTTRSHTVPTGGPGVVRPHAVTGVTTTAPGQATAISQYAHDSAGNSTCRPAGTPTNTCSTGAGSQALQWDAEGKLASVSTAGQTLETSVYDADGVRLIRKDATGTTLYLPGQEIRRPGTVNVGTRYYTFAGQTIASRTGSSAITALTWLSSDNHGTQQLAINAGTQALSVRRQTPYGGSRGTNPAWVNGKGFVGGDIDPTALVNIGARRYDTALGRFISVDPILDLADPRQWNPYTYANNNAATLFDSTGLLTEGMSRAEHFRRELKAREDSSKASSGGHGGKGGRGSTGHARPPTWTAGGPDCPYGTPCQRTELCLFGPGQSCEGTTSVQCPANVMGPFQHPCYHPKPPAPPKVDDGWAISYCVSGSLQLGDVAGLNGCIVVDQKGWGFSGAKRSGISVGGGPGGGSASLMVGPVFSNKNMGETYDCEVFVDGSVDTRRGIAFGAGHSFNGGGGHSTGWGAGIGASGANSGAATVGVSCGRSFRVMEW